MVKFYGEERLSLNVWNIQNHILFTNNNLYLPFAQVS